MQSFKAPIRAGSVPNPRLVPLSRCCFPYAGGAPPAPGFQGNSTSWLYPSGRFEPFRGCPRNAELAGHLGRFESGGRRKPLPRKNRLTMPPAQTALLYQIPLSRTLIFSASGLYGFCSSAFPENLLLNRKSFSENFRLGYSSRRPPGF